MKYKIISAVILLAFLVIYSYLPLTSPPKYTSPDENTNYFFSIYFSENGKLWYSEPLNLIGAGIIHPRSTVYINEHVAPNGFLGMYVIYGTLISVSVSMLPFLTPLVAVIGTLFYYILIRNFFGGRIALISSSLLLVFPPYWYWASNTLFNNLLATVFFLAGFAYITYNNHQTSQAPKYQHYLLGGLFLGLCLFIRLDSILLVIPLLSIRFIHEIHLKLRDRRYFDTHKYFLYRWILMGVFLCLGLSPLLFLNQELYGNPFVSPSQIYFSGSVSPQVTNYIFNPSTIVINLLNYGIQLTPLWSTLIILGIVALVFNLRQMNRSKEYLLYFSFIFIISCLFYLSSSALTGNFVEPSLYPSNVRYMLAVYCLSLPFLCLTITSLRSNLMSTSLITILVVASAGQVLVGDTVNLNYLSDKKNSYYEQSLNFQSEFTPEGVILCRYYDKIIFPDFKVGCFHQIDNASVLGDVVESLIKNNVSTYLIDDKAIDSEMYIQELLDRNISLTLKNKDLNIYQVSKD